MQVKQFVYSNLGDIAKYCPSVLQPNTVVGIIESIIPDLIV